VTSSGVLGTKGNANKDQGTGRAQPLPEVQLLPRKPLSDSSPRAVIDALPAIVAELLTATMPRGGDAERDWMVIDARMGLESRPRTLDEVAQAILGGATREWARQLEARALARIRRVFESGYAGRGFQLRAEASAGLEAVYAAAPTMSEPLIPEDRLLAVLCLPKTPSSTVACRLAFLMELRDVIRLDGNGPRRPPIWYAGRKREGDELVGTVDRIDQLLTTEIVEPITLLDLLVELNGRGTNKRLSAGQVRDALSLCNTIERTEDGKVQGRFEWLSGRGNQAFRLILTAGTPLDAEAMVREINSRTSVYGPNLDRQNLVNQMTRDKRLIPIGKSGAWGIKGVHDQSARNIADLMREYLKKRGTPASSDEIHAVVAALRPVAENSVSIYLSSLPEFVRLPDKTWVMADWKEAKTAPSAPRTPRIRRMPTLRDHVASEAFAALDATKSREMPLGDVVDLLVKNLKRPRSTFYQYIDGLESVEKVHVGSQVLVRLKDVVSRSGGVRTPAEVRALIASGESRTVEFKSSLRWDLRQGVENPSLQKMCTKSMAAFMNGDGGVLLIGIEDTRAVFGIEKDMELLASVGQGGTDGFGQALANVVKQHLGASVAALYWAHFVAFDGRTTCVVDVNRSPRPIYLTDGRNKEFFVRLETTTQQLGMEEGGEYVRVHWPASKR
jgi:hypothetical protein